jgi:hypothetical protein
MPKVAAPATSCCVSRRDAELMDMFLLFVVIFLCVMVGVGLSALLLSLLFRGLLRLSGANAARRLPVVPAASQAPPSL